MNPDSSDRSVVDYFDGEATGWNDKYTRSRLFRSRHDEFQRLLQRFATPVECAVDYGCGAGNLTPLLARFARESVATDASSEMRRITAERFDADPAIRVAAPDELAEWGHGACGLVLCSSVIEYVDDDVAFLARLAALLEPGGLLLITFPNRVGPLQLWNRWIRSRLSKRSYSHHQKRRYGAGRVRRLLREVGLQPLDVHSAVGLPLLRNMGLGELIFAVARKPPIQPQ